MSEFEGSISTTHIYIHPHKHHTLHTRINVHINTYTRTYTPHTHTCTHMHTCTHSTHLENVVMTCCLYIQRDVVFVCSVHLCCAPVSVSLSSCSLSVMVLVMFWCLFQQIDSTDEQAGILLLKWEKCTSGMECVVCSVMCSDVRSFYYCKLFAVKSQEQKKNRYTLQIVYFEKHSHSPEFTNEKSIQLQIH